MRTIIVLTFLLCGCTINCAKFSDCKAGPMHITHKHGEMPKVKINTGVDDVKLKARQDKVYLEYKKRF